MWLCTCTVPSIVPHHSSINTRPLVQPDSRLAGLLDPMTPPIHLGVSLFLPKWQPRQTHQTSDVLSCQHHVHVTALSDLCVQCDDVERGGRSEYASDW